MVIEKIIIPAFDFQPNILLKPRFQGILRTISFMRGSLLFLILFLIACSVHGQKYSVEDFLYASSLSPKKLESYLNKKKFVRGGSSYQSDIAVNVYHRKIEKNKKKKDTLNITRSIETFYTKSNSSFTYITSLKNEYIESLKELKEEEFYCGNENDTVRILFQKRNVSVVAKRIIEKDVDTLYSIAITHHVLPLPEEIQFAEDLLRFYSHEYLVSFFGQKNVIRDIYYFSEKEVAKCTVLFPKTSRQAVFIWEDNINLCKPAYLIIGGNMKAGSITNYDGIISENVWNSKDGIYSGMSLNSLMKLNGNSFKFYGKNSDSPYMIVPEKTGAINFKTNRVVLGCLNPTGSRLLNNATIGADEILSDNLGLYVYMMMILPSSVSNK
jgi:hypothetical protein